MKSVVLVFILAATVASAQTNNLTSLLQQGLLEEQANRNLDAAIANYQTLAAQFDKDRQLAATAIFRIGECYRMQGKTNEAAAQYQRVLHDFADQTTLATLSRQNLTGMGVNAAPSAVATPSPDSSDAQLWNSLKGLSRPELEKVLPTLSGGDALTKLLQQRNESETRLAVAQIDYGPTNVVVLRVKAEIEVLNHQIADTIDGEMQVLKIRAVISGSANSTTATSAGSETTDEEDQEIRRIQQMIQNSPDLINVRVRGGGGTPLETAAAAGWIKVATYLLDHGADVNAGEGTAPLLAAVHAGNKAMTQFLLAHGANVNAKDDDGKTALTIAAETSFPAVVEVLLANQADLNPRDNFGGTPLMWAAWQKRDGSGKIIEILLQHKPDVNAQNLSGATALMHAADVGSDEVVKALLAAEAAPNITDDIGRTALSYAVANGSPERVRMLLAAKADPNGGTLNAPLLVAIHAKDTNAAELLLAAGAKANTKQMFDWQGGNRGWTTPLQLAVSTKQFPMVQLLLKYKADPNNAQTDGRSLLFSAMGDTNILESLLAAGAKVDPVNLANNVFDQQTPLDMAVYAKNTATVEILLKHGANPNVRNSQDVTSLHYAAFGMAGSNIFQLLLDYKADPNVRTTDGYTPLNYLKRKADPNAILTTSLETRTLASQLADLLRQHGALDKLPDWDRIAVSRPTANVYSPFFYQGSNDWNHVSLYDLIGAQYDLITSAPAGKDRATARPYSNYAHGDNLPFPDFTSVLIHRPSADGLKWETRKVDLIDALNSGNCAGDVMLQFGDVVEIPEANHVLNQQWDGLTTNELATLKTCLTRHLQITVNGQTTNFVVSPQITIGPPDGSTFAQRLNYINNPNKAQLTTFEPFMLWPVLDESKTLLSSSDLSQVKVRRHDAVTGKMREWTVDCSNPKLPPNFWLRDGDVIEVPERR